MHGEFVADLFKYVGIVIGVAAACIAAGLLISWLVYVPGEGQYRGHLVLGSIALALVLIGIGAGFWRWA